jgi:hypothetical protein
MNPHTPKWAPTLEVGISMDFQIFKGHFEGSKFIGLKFPYTIGKLLDVDVLNGLT